jgi:LPXTG-site transpeptidase (sortase) family protein
MSLEVDYKKERHPGRWVALFVFILVLAASGWYGYKWYTTGALPPVPLPIAVANTKIDESSVSSALVKDHTVDPMHPRYINIPSLNPEDTRVYPVGLDSNNLLEAPNNIHDAGWYRQSGVPGDGGVVLIQAHNVGVTKKGAFSGLNSLNKGDTIMIERGDGEVFTYSVVENQRMTIEEVNATGMAMMGVSAENGKEALNLITFDGVWVPRLGMFDHRIMLRAVIVED